jgi:hypothetical protein
VDNHPNANSVKIIADEEFKTITGLWPERLPTARQAKRQMRGKQCKATEMDKYAVLFSPNLPDRRFSMPNLKESPPAQPLPTAALATDHKDDRHR